MLKFVREGDTVNVHSIDRLARNSADLLRLVGDFKTLGVSVVFHHENLTFSAGNHDPMHELMLSMIGALAQFERSVLKERQAEGIEKAKVKGVYKGTKQRIDRNAVLKLLSEGVSPAQVAKILGIGRNSTYRIKAETT
jgi:DNA invertase Pin-like site-specific DNA recombinase